MSRSDARFTVADPQVLTDAVKHDLQNLPGVTHAFAVLCGTATAPELTIRVAATDRTDLRQLVSRIRSDVVADLNTAMDAPLQRLGVQSDIGTSRRSANHITL